MISKENAWPNWSAEFFTLRELLEGWAERQSDAIALSDSVSQWSWSRLIEQVHAVASGLLADGLDYQEPVALIGRTDAAQLIAYLGVIVAGGIAVPLPLSATSNQLSKMLVDCKVRRVFVDSDQKNNLTDLSLSIIEISPDRNYIQQDKLWLIAKDFTCNVRVLPMDAFNIIYSSGTTGQPKGIVHSHKMRWMNLRRAERYKLTERSLMLVSTPLYSNTSLVAILPTLAAGGRVHLMSKFNAVEYLNTAQALQATHTILVPVQYQRLMALSEFDKYDLGAFEMKICTTAPCTAELKSQILKRWPGALLEIYGMTEGGGTFLLDCDLYPYKLHTVGQPSPGHVICLLDENSKVIESKPGAVGEVAGHSASMMTGYFNDPIRTAEAEWFDDHGRRFIRTGDLASFDEDGFLVLKGRKKDMIISGGFNIYPIDLETVLSNHPLVSESAVIGVHSDQWGETPVAYVVPVLGTTTFGVEELKSWFASQVGKTQRLSAVYIIDELPRNAIGKVDKNKLRELYLQTFV